MQEDRLPWAAPQGFNLKTLKHLVLDEADRLLNMDFEKEIDEILKVIPKVTIHVGCRTRPGLGFGRMGRAPRGPARGLRYGPFQALCHWSCAI